MAPRVAGKVLGVAWGAVACCGNICAPRGRGDSVRVAVAPRCECLQGGRTAILHETDTAPATRSWCSVVVLRRCRSGAYLRGINSTAIKTGSAENDGGSSAQLQAPKPLSDGSWEGAITIRQVFGPWAC